MKRDQWNKAKTTELLALVNKLKDLFFRRKPERDLLLIGIEYKVCINSKESSSPVSKGLFVMSINEQKE